MTGRRCPVVLPVVGRCGVAGDRGWGDQLDDNAVAANRDDAATRGVLGKKGSAAGVGYLKDVVAGVQTGC